MRKICICIAVLFLSATLYAQTDSIVQPPYKRFPTFPPVNLLLTDSTKSVVKNNLPKKKPVMVIIFSPDCDHCQHETEDLLQHIDKFKNVTIVMITGRSYGDMMEFRKKYGLDQYKNIIMGQDTDFFTLTFYNIKSLPFLAFYNKKGELISVFAGTLPMEKALLELEK